MTELQKKEQDQAPAGEGKEPAGKKTAPSDTARIIRIGIIVLLVGFGGFLLWAAFAPLDEGVPCTGTVTVSTSSKVVQHLTGGIVHAVHVHEGRMVKKGDLLLSLASKEAIARYKEVYQRYLGLRAAEARLVALANGKGKPRFHPDLHASPDTAFVREIMQTQRELFASERRRLTLLKDRLGGLRELVAEGFAPRSKMMELEQQVADIESERASEMADVQVAVDAYAKKSAALREELDLREIRAPATGQVIGLGVQTVGAVVRPGEKIMDIVPEDELLLIDVKILPHLIDKVGTGQAADIRFASFANSPMLFVDGVVESVSFDLLTDPNMNPAMPGAQYYLARVTITGQGMKTLGRRQLMPGMPVQVVIKTGERSLLTYLLHPLVKRVSASMKEE